MWKRDEAVKRGGHTQPAAAPVGPAAPPPAAEAPRAQPMTAAEPHRGLERTVNIGKSVIIKGELNGSEDLTIDGQVEGKIELRQNVLTIGPNGKIRAQVFAKAVVILGEVTGNVTATEKVDIRDNGSVDGDITAPRVAIAEGAHFRGSIDMQRTGAKPGEGKAEQKVEPRAEPKAEPKAEQRVDHKPNTPAAPTPQPTPAVAAR